MTVDLIQDFPAGLEANRSPKIQVFDDFVQASECQHLVGLASQQLSRSHVCGEQGGYLIDSRTSRTHWLKHDEDDITFQLASRISTLVGLPLANAESFQIINYQVTQEYRAHHDAWDLNSASGKRCTQKGGQRMITALAYLNTVTEGGGTAFPKLDMEVRSKQGRLLVFHNCQPGTNTLHPDTLHSGLPVIAGEKWAFNLWFRERALQSPEGGPYKTSGFSRVIE